MAARIARLPNHWIAGFVSIFVLISGCSQNPVSHIPADFYFMLDIRSAGPGNTQNIHIQIDASGEGTYQYYDTGGVIHYDPDHVVTFDNDQVVREGAFHCSQAELARLWQAIQDQQFFNLADDYQMALGHSYAFLLVQADRQKHTVNNIGMEVPEVREIVESARQLLPAGVEPEYGEGYIPGS
ncbi:MAG TPA: hypothetical protein VFY26_04455 [Anaerolineales bacterium]|nr:hypothetical protein [Anaerolineales bacterium]